MGTSCTRPPDWQERERALDIRRSWIVEAPAGSGKTGLLIQRYLKLLADESVEDPSQVLAITFTVKATAEMRERVINQLESAARSEPLKNDSDFDRVTRVLAEMVLRRDALLGWELLQHPRRLNIRTIDSVCGEVARLLPVLSGAGGRQIPVEDATLMYREAARETLMQLGGADVELDTALRTVLLHRDGSLRDCERLLMEMLPLRNQWGELVPLGTQQLDDAFLDETVLPKLELALEQAVCVGLTLLSLSVPADILQELTSLAGEMGHAEGYRGSPSPIAMCAGLHQTPQETSEDLERWRGLIHLLTTQESKWRATAARNHLGFEIERHHAERLKLLVQQLRDRDDVLEAIKRVRSLPPVQYPQEQWVVAKALFRVLNRALAELQLVFARREECDFAELGLLARVVLQREGAVADLNKALGMSLQHLLVDEMQDTSSGQYELIQLLTQRWDGHGQTVFLVGDPKQSIYLFRQARVERFVKTMQTEFLGDLPVGRLQLTANFRSQRTLVEAFNDDFSLLFPRKISATNPEDVPYVEARAVRGPSRSGSMNLVWHARVLASETSAEATKRAKRRQARLEAEKVRAIVEHWRDRPLPQGRSEPWKVAVLVRSRNLLTEIVTELKDELKGAIPFRAVDIEALGQRQEVLDLFALTRALMHPADRVAWLAVLRAPWCGLGRGDLHLLAGGDDPDWAERCMGDVIAERLDLLEEEIRARVMRVWPVLQAAEEKRSGLSVAQWVERTWRTLGGDAYLKPGELANARRYLQLLDEMEEYIGGIDVSLLKRQLDKLFAQPAARGWAVDLMTIHKSKGLEWDVVIVPGLQKKDPADRERLLTWSEIDSDDTEAAHIMLAPIAGRGEGSRALNLWLRGIDKAKKAAERKRLFYVACTRAREELHLFASPEATARGEVIRPYGSLLATAWPAAERHFTRGAPASERLVQMPMMFPKSEEEEGFVGTIAAGADEAARPAMLQRLPMEFRLESRFSASRKLSYGEDAIAPGPAHFERPEGSFEARAFGIAVHAFLEMLATKLADGTRVEAVLHEVAGWTPRIASVLRGDGLHLAVVERLVPRVKTALTNMLQDNEGRWVLSQHKQASNELSLNSWNDARSSVRLDRVFYSGAQPMETGADYLWIIDYKTATHGREGLTGFLAEERIKYAEQMKVYARMMRGRVESGRLRVGLYYPMLPKLVWWEPETD
ncbi:UvrD-helicase domain-containing protein [Tunturibacter empetritectus]|uniref:DNA 3'-5' helicase n=1 Tax=Tunturiibacter lichenicola TaxID=2051959 RepID=A0A7W8JB70_9BACT|nr:UvrD-helicase domain-containing protein [Edaphobacter lichenicola]MBB5346044.1 ATP-dependent exoDNAse (exonuclease V) beta subunit [Edaphobacter lichenicola]